MLAMAISCKCQTKAEVPAGRRGAVPILRVGYAERESTYAYEQALISLKLKKAVDAGVGRTFAVIIEGV